MVKLVLSRELVPSGSRESPKTPPDWSLSSLAKLGHGMSLEDQAPLPIGSGRPTTGPGHPVVSVVPRAMEEQDVLNEW